MAGNHQVSKVVKLDSSIADRLERLGEIKDRSPHWLMKEAIVHYLDEEEYNEQINRETLASWEQIKEGKMVSHQAMVKWLNTWGTDEETDRPPCEE